MTAPDPVDTIETDEGAEIEAELGRFAMTPEWVLFSETLSDRAVRLYGVLHRYADKETGRAFPARRTLAGRLSCSVDSVDRALRELVAAGAVTKRRRLDVKGDQTSNLYTVRFIDPSRTGAATPQGRGDRGPRGRGSNESQIERENPSESLALLVDDETAKRGTSGTESPQRKPRTRDPIWDALVAIFPAETPSEQSFTGKIVRELKQMDPVPESDDVRRRAEWVRDRFENASVAAVTKHWTAAGKALDNPRNRRLDLSKVR